MESLTSRLPLLAALSLFFMTSCSDITSEIWIEKDGGGRMELSVDVAAFFPQELMNSLKDELGDSLDLDGNDAYGLDEVIPKQEKGPKDEIERLFALMLEDGVVKDIDTTFNLYSMMPDSIKEEAEDDVKADILKRITMHLKGDSDKGSAITKFSMTFKDENEMQEMLAGLNQAFTKKEGEEISEAEKKKTIAQFKSNYKRGIIQLPTLKVPDKLGENMPGDMPEGLDQLGGLLGGDDDEEMSEDDEAQMDFMKNMFGSIVVKVHAPGPIQFTNDPDAEIYGNTVIFKKSIMDFGKGPEKGRIIKFGK